MPPCLPQRAASVLQPDQRLRGQQGRDTRTNKQKPWDPRRLPNCCSDSDAALFQGRGELEKIVSVWMKPLTDPGTGHRTQSPAQPMPGSAQARWTCWVNQGLKSIPQARLSEPPWNHRSLSGAHTWSNPNEPQQFTSPVCVIQPEWECGLRRSWIQKMQNIYHLMFISWLSF